MSKLSGFIESVRKVGGDTVGASVSDVDIIEMINRNAALILSDYKVGMRVTVTTDSNGEVAISSAGVVPKTVIIGNTICTQVRSKEYGG